MTIPYDGVLNIRMYKQDSNVITYGEILKELTTNNQCVEIDAKHVQPEGRRLRKRAGLTYDYHARWLLHDDIVDIKEIKDGEVENHVVHLDDVKAMGEDTVAISVDANDILMMSNQERSFKDYMRECMISAQMKQVHEEDLNDSVIEMYTTELNPGDVAEAHIERHVDYYDFLDCGDSVGYVPEYGLCSDTEREVFYGE